MDLDLSRHRNLSSFYTIVPDYFPGLDSSSVPKKRFNPTLRTLTVEHVYRAGENNVQYSLRVCAEIDRLALPALEHVHIRMHDSVDDICYYFAECNCEVRVPESKQGRWGS